MHIRNPETGMRMAPLLLLRRQQGATLIVSMLMLIVLTLLGVTAMSTSDLEEKMAGNTRDLNLAFQAAEAALMDGEEFVRTGFVSTAVFDGSYDGLYPPPAGGVPPDYYDSAVWTTARTYSGTIAEVNQQPKYIVELMGNLGSEDININGYGESSGVSDVDTFRITARGTGGSDNAAVLLQSYFAR